MQKTITINGMMCMHCEARVKKALEALENVQNVSVSAEKGNAVVESTVELPAETLKKAVEEAGYEVVLIV